MSRLSKYYPEMRTIYKYPLSEGVEVSSTYEIIRVGIQNLIPYVWILVDLDQIGSGQTTLLRFHVMGTGWNNITDDMMYVGSYTEDEYVWHVFY